MAQKTMQFGVADDVSAAPPAGSTWSEFAAFAAKLAFSWVAVFMALMQLFAATRMPKGPARDAAIAAAVQALFLAFGA